MEKPELVGTQLDAVADLHRVCAPIRAVLAEQVNTVPNDEVYDPRGDRAALPPDEDRVVDDVRSVSRCVLHDERTRKPSCRGPERDGGHDEHDRQGEQDEQGDHGVIVDAAIRATASILPTPRAPRTLPAGPA
ncbi:hypothetical protein [uncultured Microbacterium sp.]|uniref:hypothetical protein n=1 Tax=uncultured Microbacterium sp. TaxID=191216 RepID=UPI00345B9DFB